MLYFCPKCRVVYSIDPGEVAHAEGEFTTWCGVCLKNDVKGSQCKLEPMPAETPSQTALETVAARITDEAVALLILGPHPAHVARVREMLKGRIVEILKSKGI